MTFSLSAAGLLIDAIGAGLIFFNSPEVSFGTCMYTKAELKDLDKKAAAIRFRARTGFAMLCFGALLQLTATVFPMV